MKQPLVIILAAITAIILNLSGLSWFLILSPVWALLVLIFIAVFVIGLVTVITELYNQNFDN